MKELSLNVESVMILLKALESFSREESPMAGRETERLGRRHSNSNLLKE